MIDLDYALQMLKLGAAQFADTGAGAAQKLSREGVDGEKLQAMAVYVRAYEEEDDNRAACVWFVANFPSFMQDAAPIFRMAGNHVAAFAKAGVSGAAGGSGGSDAAGTSAGSTNFVDFAKYAADAANTARTAQGKINNLTGISAKLKSGFRTGRAAASGFSNYMTYRALRNTEHEEMYALSSCFLIGGVSTVEALSSDGDMSFSTRYYISQSTFAAIVDEAVRVGHSWMGESLFDYARGLLDAQTQQYLYDTDDNSLSEYS